MSDRPMVRLRDVSKGYGSSATRVEVLQDLDLDVDRGELVAVIGPSGVGKSTLLHLIGLLDRPESGTLELEGDAVGGLDGEARARLRNQLIGFVFQHHHLLDELDALDNVALPLRIAGWAPRRARSRPGEPLSRPALRR
jgi:ABC-type lipoprotein export system ATPase subunit